MNNRADAWAFEVYTRFLRWVWASLPSVTEEEIRQQGAAEAPVKSLLCAEGVFGISFRAHPHPNPFWNEGGVHKAKAHSSPWIETVFVYGERPGFPEWRYITVFRTVSGQEFGRDHSVYDRNAGEAPTPYAGTLDQLGAGGTCCGDVEETPVDGKRNGVLVALIAHRKTLKAIPPWLVWKA